MRNNKINYILFLCAILVTFTFLTMLQFFKVPVFFIMLVLMHLGIVLFIVSKKRFLKDGVDCKKYYVREYIMLALYIPVLIYKLLSKTGWYEVNYEVKAIVVIVLTVISLILSTINAVDLLTKIKKLD